MPPRRLRSTLARTPLALRLLVAFVFEVLSAAAVVGGPGAWLLRRADWARLAGVQASAALGRPVQVGGLTLAWGQPVRVELTNASIAGLDAADPPLATVRHLAAGLDRAALLRGRVVLERLAVDGLAVMLQRTERGPNWRFGPASPGNAVPRRAGFPSLRELRVRDSQVAYRLAGGRTLLTRLDDATATAAADDAPAHLAIAGSYNGTPLSLDADLRPIDALRDAREPYGTVLHFASGTARLTFDGTMTDPLGFDGLRGTLLLDAEDPAPVFALAGLGAAPDVQWHLDGPFEHAGPAWRLRDVKGQIGQDELARGGLDFEEGAGSAPDSLALDLQFESLDLNELLGAPAHGRRGADAPLAVSPTPATLIRAKLATRRLDYADWTAASVTLQGAQTPGRIAVETLAMEVFGTRLTARGAVEAAGADTGRVTAEVSIAGAELAPLARALGFGPLPLSGRLEAQGLLDATARTLNAATREARVSAVVAMRGGQVQKQVVEKASTDIRSLFRTDRGQSRITCLLAGVDMRAGLGTVAPLRLRAADGTIAGSARFDLNRRTMDLTIGSERATTGPFALDIPVRVSGPFNSPAVSPAQWSAQGREQLAAADSLSALPPALREWAKRYPCPR